MRFLAAVMFCALASSAFATEVDFSTVIISPDGPFKECRQYDPSGKCLELVDLTLRRLCIAAASQPERDVSVVEQVKHGKLAHDLINAEKLSLSAEDIAFLKKQIGKLGYSTIAVYQAIKLLDPDSIEK